MSNAYHHGLASDWKQRSAMATASKVGGAYTGWKPKEPSKITAYGLCTVVIWMALAAAVAVGVGL